MTAPCLRRLAAIAALLVLISMPALTADTPPASTAKETGELWEVTTQMSMEGMPMALPAQTQKACAPKDWKEPPGGTDERRKCQSSDFKVDGPKTTWKLVCAGPPAMTGEGEMTRDGADAYAGSIKFTSANGPMTVKISGRRLGACDSARK